MFLLTIAYDICCSEQSGLHAVYQRVRESLYLLTTAYSNHLHGPDLLTTAYLNAGGGGNLLPIDYI